jgi:O-antigen/teichoic acid export membrane protein
VGIRSSLGRFIARYVSLNQPENVNRTVSTALVMLSFGSLLALLATGVLYFSLGRFDIATDLQSPAKVALVIAGLNTSLALPLSIFGGILISLDRYDIVSRLNVASTLIRTALIVLVLKLGAGLIALATVTLAVNLAHYVVSAFWAKALYPDLRPRLAGLDWSLGKELLGFGVFRFIWIIANQLIFYSDSVVIGIVINASAITYFAIAGSLINYGREIIAQATDTLYPAASRLDSQNDLAGLQRLHIMGTRMALLLALPLCLGFIFFGRQFITLWMGPQYASSASILLVLALAQFTSIPQNVSALVLAGMAKHKILGYIVVCEGAANLLLSLYLGRKYGLIGIAWGTVIPHVIATGIIVPSYALRMLQLSPNRYFSEAIVRPVVCAVPVGILSYVLSRSVDASSWLIFLGEAVSIAGTFGVLSYFICLTAQQKAMVVGHVRSFFQRQPLVSGA